MVDQYDKHESLKDIELFYFAYRSFTAEPDRILREWALNRVHHRILYFVARNPKLSINELLTILEVSKQALNAPLRKLVEKGLIEVSHSKVDRRLKLLCLSKAGRELESRLTNTQIKFLETVFERTGKRNAAGWRKVMEQLPKV